VTVLRPHAPLATDGLACGLLVAGPLLLLADAGTGVWIATGGLGLFACVRLLGAGVREAALLCAIGSLLATFGLRSMPRPPEPRAAFRAVAGMSTPAPGVSAGVPRSTP